MAGEINDDRGQIFYSHFYSTGGWKYSFWREYRWHRRHIMKRFQLRRGMKMLEVACGCGFHTNLFNRMGFHCTGVDRSRNGIAWAKTHYPSNNYICSDLRDMPLEYASFDVIIARGCSYYHYNLMDDVSLHTSKTLLRYLKQSGVFVMAIATDLSGRREPDKIWHNTLDDYREHFSAHNRKWSVDWVKGMAICGLYNQPLPDTSTHEETLPHPYLAATQPRKKSTLHQYVIHHATA